MDDSLSDSRPLRILIADDSDSDRLILKTLLRRLGHEVEDARNGSEAVDIFQTSGADIVLLDALMPVMDGMEAAHHIKALAGERMVPLIFLTSLSDADALARCLEAGGDDFLTKPYNRVIIQAKINAFNRMRLMHRTLSQHRDLIRDRNRLLLNEQEVAKRVFDNVAHTGCLDAPNIRYHASPMSIFNGDILFACPRPAGGMQILVGDFTGHGLPAAIGAMPVAEIFYGMTSKGFNGSDVLREINQKLGRILPTGMFCCAAMIQADFHLNQLRIWNGGLPDGVLIRKHGVLESIASRHLPLGVLGAARFDAGMEVFHTEPGDTLLMMTDGVMEAENSHGEMYGEERLKGSLRTAGDQDSPFDTVMAGIHDFTGKQPEQDDVTLLSLQMVKESELTGLSERLPPSALEGPAEWHCVYEIQDRSLEQFSPLPLLLHICMEVPGLRRKSGEIYTLLSELYTNSLEHGVLGLSSGWKATPDGFGRYYAERERRLKSVSGHFIRFTLTHTMTSWGGQLTIVCEDSGAGFDYGGHTAARNERGYAGRGLMLLQKLGRSLNYREYGTRAEIVYDWQFSEVASHSGAPTNNHGVGHDGQTTP